MVLTTPITDYNGGTYTSQYGAWYLYSKDGKVIKSSSFEPVQGIYDKQVTITAGQGFSDMYLVGIAYQYDLIFDNDANAWRTANKGIVQEYGVHIVEGNMPQANAPSSSASDTSNGASLAGGTALVQSYDSNGQATTSQQGLVSSGGSFMQTYGTYLVVGVIIVLAGILVYINFFKKKKK